MNKLQWEIYVPIFRNKFILQGIGLVIGIPFGTLIAIILIVSKGNVFGTDAKYALGMIALLFLLTFIRILFVYGGKYEPGFIVDNEGIINYTQAKQAKRNKILNTLLIKFGALSARPSSMGSGMIAQSKQVMQLKWKNIKKVVYYPKQHTIIVRGGYTEKIAVFCTKENYTAVETIVKEKIASIG